MHNIVFDVARTTVTRYSERWQPSPFHCPHCGETAMWQQEEETGKSTSALHVCLSCERWSWVINELAQGGADKAAALVAQLRNTAASLQRDARAVLDRLSGIGGNTGHAPGGGD